MQVKIQKENINFAEELELFSSRNFNSGSIVSFLGKVRERSIYGKVKSIFIENYEEMNKLLLKELINNIKRKYSIDDGIIIHRFGKLNVGENIVLVLIASQHREEAFKALTELVNWLKVNATFWKKEITDKGEFWVEQKKSDVQKIKSSF